MVREDIVNLVKSATAQAMGSDYMSNVGELTGLDAQKLVSIGKDVIDAGSVDGFVKCCATQMLKFDVDSKEFEIGMPPILIDRINWLGYIQCVDFDVVDVYSDPMRNLVDGRDYSDVEHKFYKPKANSKIFDEVKTFMCPISMGVSEFEDACRSWADMDKFLTGIRVSVRNTIKIQLKAMADILCGTGAIISIKKTNTAIHLMTEAAALGIISNATDVAAALKNTAFLKFCMERMAEIKDNMKIATKVYNNHNSLKLTDENDYRFMLHNQIARKFKYSVLADTYNADLIGIGKHSTFSSWQAIKDATNTTAFNYNTTTSIKFNADESAILGLGTEAINESNIIGLMFHAKAIGMSMYNEKTTVSNTHSADFWTQYTHELVMCNINENFPIVAFVLD